MLMPLPPGGGAWPPTEFAPVTERLRSWSAWYSGSPDELAEVYGQIAGYPYDSIAQGRILNRPSQYRTGVIGWFARWFWGEPANQAQKRAKLHVPLAGDIARTSAELLFSEPPDITVPPDATGATKTQDRLDQLVDEGVHATLIEAAEMCAALGGVYLVTCWDTDVNSGRPWLTARAADMAVPQWQWGKLSAVTFWEILAADDRKVIRHLERHEKGYIYHGVYEGSSTDLGDPVDLAAFPQTENLEPVYETGVQTLTAGYIPNMRPNRLWRNLPAAMYCGRSDFAGVEPLLDALDETYSSWMRDVRLGKARLIIPEAYLESLGKGSGARWDPDREVYEGLNMLGDAGLEQVQFSIRWQEHQETAQHQVEQILRGSGYSSQTFGLSGDTAVTAREVTAREKSSITTRGRKILYWAPGVAERLENLLQIDQAVFKSGVEPVLPDVEFGEYVGEEPTATAQTAQLLRAAEAASTETLVGMIHQDWDEDQVAEEVARIKSETPALNVPAPADLGMGDGSGAGTMNGSGVPAGLDPNAGLIAGLNGGNGGY